MALKKSKKIVSAENRSSGLVLLSVLIGLHAVIISFGMLSFFAFFPMAFIMGFGKASVIPYSMMLFFAIGAFVVAVLEIYTAYSLYHKKSWSRLVASVFAALMLNEPTKKVFPS